MKKLILAVLGFVIMTSFAYGGEEVNIMRYVTTSRPWAIDTTNTPVDLQTTYSNGTCQSKWDGQYMSSTTIRIKGGVTASGVASLRGASSNTTSTTSELSVVQLGVPAQTALSQATASSTAIFTFSHTPVRFVGASYEQSSGGSATSSMRIDCLFTK